MVADVGASAMSWIGQHSNAELREPPNMWSLGLCAARLTPVTRTMCSEVDILCPSQPVSVVAVEESCFHKLISHREKLVWVGDEAYIKCTAL